MPHPGDPKKGVWTTPEVEMIKDKLNALCTTKPVVYCVNLTKKDFIRKKNKWLVDIHNWIKAGSSRRTGSRWR